MSVTEVAWIVAKWITDNYPGSSMVHLQMDNCWLVSYHEPASIASFVIYKDFAAINTTVLRYNDPNFYNKLKQTIEREWPVQHRGCNT